MSQIHIQTVTEDEEGIRLDRWVKRHFPDIHHSQIEKLLRKKDIKVDGKKATSNQRLEIGQEIRIVPVSGNNPAARPKKTIELSHETIAKVQSWILYKNQHVIALNKPAPFAVQGGSGVSESVDSLLDALKFDAESRPKLVHRLDKDTSGVLLIARNPKSAASLSAAFKGKKTVKTYWALVAGTPHPLEGDIKLPLHKAGGQGNEKMVVDRKNGKFSHTHYRVVETIGREAAWVELSPITGRTHQLRAHMVAIGTPIIGDGKYGGKDAFIEGISQKMQLHARHIHIPHILGDVIDVSAPLPPHMKKNWDLFGFPH